MSAHKIKDVYNAQQLEQFGGRQHLSSN